MATIYDEAGIVVATGVGVSDASQLGQGRTDVVHDPLLGGLPYVVRKASSGYAGSLELLCSDVDTAWAIHQAHAAGLVRLDTYTRLNLLPDPRMTATSWTQAGSTGTFTRSVAAGPNGRGYWRYQLDTATTASPMVIGLTGTGTSGVAVAPGQDVTLSSYWRCAPAIEQSQRFDLSWYDTVGAQISTNNGPDEFPGTMDPNTWLRVSHTFQAPANAAYVQPKIVWSGTYVAGNILDVADALLEDGPEMRPWFDGSYAPPGYASRWDGLENASTSSLSALPAFDMTYSAVNGVDVPHQLDEGIWSVRVPQLREVAA